MAEIRRLLEADDRGLADWLRGRKTDDSAFLFAIDQFEELFTFADPADRSRFDRLVATALDDADCPLFVISTVRADFLDRVEALPRLVAVRNRLARLVRRVGLSRLRLPQRRRPEYQPRRHRFPGGVFVPICGL